MISQDGFFLPPPPPNSAPPPPISSNNNGFLQDDQNFIINNTSSSSSSYPNPNPNPSPNNPSTILTPSGSAANNNNNKRKRNLPGTPDPEAEVVALSPRSLMATNRFICEICNKGFQRDQNLQLHRRGHNLPWKLKQRANKDLPVKKKVYICPEKTCVHHDPSRALGDLTGIKKHFSRKHGEKKWKCDKCSKKYAVMSDWKAHSKICGTREYKCDCGTIFSRKDSFITHRAFCDALTEERMRVVTNTTNINHHQNATLNHHNYQPDHLINTSSLLTNNNTSSSSSFSTFNPSDTSCNKQHQVPQRSSLPLWLDHLHSTPQPPINHHHHHMDLIPTAPSNSGQILTDHQFSQPTAANLNLFSSQSSTSYPGPMLPKEEDIHLHHHHHHQDQLNKTPTNYPHSLISLYNSSSSPSSLSPPGNMSATALLQKAAQIGSTRSNGNSSVFATAFGHVMNNNNNNSSSTSPSPSLSNNNEPTTQRNQNHHLLNNHTTKQSSSTNHLSSSAAAPYSSGNLLDHHMQHHHHNKYSSSASLMGGNDITGMRDQLGHGGGGGGGGNSSGGNNTLGMRDFLGTLGGSGSGNTTNTNSNSRSVLGGGGGERRMLNSQDDHRNQMGYNFAAAMAVAGSTSTAHRGEDDDAREQEQYMDLMSQFNVDK